MDFPIPPEMRWLSREVRPFLRWHLASFLCISAGSVLSLLAPLVLKWLIDVVLPSRTTGPLLLAVSLMFFCYQGRAVFASVGGYLTIIAAQRLALNLRRRLLRHLDMLSPAYHESNPVGASLYPLTEPVDEIAYFGSDLVPSILRTVMAAVLTLGTMLILNRRLTLAVLPLVPAFLLTRRRYHKQLEKHSEQLQTDQIRWSTFVQEHLSSIIPIQLLRKEHRQEREAFRLLGAKTRSLNQLFRTGVSFSFFTSLTTAFAMTAVVGYGSWNVLSGTLTVGGLVAFYSYLTQLFEPLSGVAETYVRAQKTFASIRQVREVFALRPDIVNHPDAIRFVSQQGCPIELAGVRFRYPTGRGSLSIDKLQISSGEMVAVVGENGAGKSTLAKLLARFYDVQAGAILIAGRDIREYTIDSLREHVCYVPPQPALFDMTIAGNLRIGRTMASESELYEALEMAGLASWVAGLDTGLCQKVGPEGVQLSRGQGQALGLARTILMAPQILILDEATSSLDAISEQRILKKLRQALSHSTIIVISHRLSTMSVVERVVLVHEGRVIEDDARNSLQHRRSAYCGLFNVTSIADAL
jgi:ABC-type multidrug transport system fused ATPase/permease subunit